MAPPIKRIRLGSQRFDIAGTGGNDPYFAAISDRTEIGFGRLCAGLIKDDYVCADIGANIGMKSLLLSLCVPHGRVIAVEPAPTVAALLEKNIAANARTNITVLKCAIGEADGTAHFTDASAYGHISTAGVEVPVRTLASLAADLHLERLDFIKIDVEGYEFPILRSSLALLDHFQSIVLLEFNSWAQLAFSGVDPKEFAEWIFGNFSNVFMVCRGGYLKRLAAEGAMEFLHMNMVHSGTLSDLVVTNCEKRLAGVQNLLWNQQRESHYRLVLLLRRLRGLIAPPAGLDRT